MNLENLWDVGANFGHYGWLFLAQRPAGQVTFVEPDQDNLALLRATAVRHRLSNVRMIAGAASNVEGTARFHRDLVSGMTGSIAGGPGFAERHWRAVPNAVDVATITIDKMAGETRVDMIKIDVEGHEESVVLGARRILARDRPVVLFECFHEAGCAKSALSVLGDRVRPVRGSGMNYLAAPEEYSGEFASLGIG